MGQCHFHLGESAISARPLVRMHRQKSRNLGPDKILRQRQDISEDESDASDDDIFEPNGDEDYEPSRAASDSSSDCDAGWRKNWKMMCSNKSCLL
jgi:hypothetical protein